MVRGGVVSRLLGGKKADMVWFSRSGGWVVGRLLGSDCCYVGERLGRLLARLEYNVSCFML